MNYCEHHLGDYAKRTRAFGLLEHGAYSMLRDRYFDTERPIPVAEVYRQACAYSKQAREAVDVVLAEFFQRDGDAWRCEAFDEQIKRVMARVEKAKQNGKKGGRPPIRLADGTQEKPAGFPLGSDSVTQAKALQTPNTNTQYNKGGDSSIAVPATQADPPAPWPDGRPEPQPAGLAAATAQAIGTRPPDHRDDDAPLPPSLAGRACLAMRSANVHDVNPAHPDLLRLLAAGVTPEEIGATAAECTSRGKGRMAYVLRTVESRRAEAAQAPKVAGPIPAHSPTVSSAAAAQTSAFLSLQENRGAVSPPPDVLAKLRAITGRAQA